MRLLGVSGEGIKDDIDFILGGSPPGYSDNDKNRNINRWYQSAFAVIMDSVAEWGFQEGLTQITLSAGVSKYALPTDILEVKRADVLYDSAIANSAWVQATPIDQHLVPGAMALSSDINGMFSVADPRYDLSDNALSGYVELFPVPFSAVTNGLRLTTTTKLTYLSASADVPVFAEPFHRILSLGAAHDWALTRKPTLAQTLKAEINELMARMAKHYGTRTKDGTTEFEANASQSFSQYV